MSPDALVDLNLADVTGDGKYDVLIKWSDGELDVLDPSIVDGNGYAQSTVLGFGWDTITAFNLADVNGDGRIDIQGRRTDGTLTVYAHSGTFTRDANGNAFGAFTAPVVLGYGWNGINPIS